MSKLLVDSQILKISIFPYILSRVLSESSLLGGAICGMQLHHVVLLYSRSSMRTLASMHTMHIRERIMHNIINHMHSINIYY